MKGVSRPVGRVLCARLRGAAVIHLGLLLPTASCGLPASIGRAALDRSRREPLAPLLTLLRVGFTEPPQSPAALVVSYTTVSPLPRRWRRGGLFSVALSRGSPRVGVTDHPALWSPDLPRRACARRDRPADSPGDKDTPRMTPPITNPRCRVRHLTTRGRAAPSRPGQRGHAGGRARTPARRPVRRTAGPGAGSGSRSPRPRSGTPGAPPRSARAACCPGAAPTP